MHMHNLIPNSKLYMRLEALTWYIWFICFTDHLKVKGRNDDFAFFQPLFTFFFITANSFQSTNQFKPVAFILKSPRSLEIFILDADLMAVLPKEKKKLDNKTYESLYRTHNVLLVRTINGFLRSLHLNSNWLLVYF